MTAKQGLIPLIKSIAQTIASRLSPGANINGVLFDGSADITVPAAAGTLTGTTLASNVVNASVNSITPTGGSLYLPGGNGIPRVWVTGNDQSSTRVRIEDTAARGGAGNKFDFIAGTDGVSNEDLTIKEMVTGTTLLTMSPTTGASTLPAGSLTVAGFVKGLSTTVSGLPSAATSGAGARAFVTDANATTFLSVVAGGGPNKVPVVSDGTNWLIG